ncbi:MAG: methyltransferase domain-containing protein [bacterium]|nr:methyltransferase domain-containing protein [bacterium]
MVCPLCRAVLEIVDNGAQCRRCGEPYPCNSGILRLYREEEYDPTNAVTARVKSFYEGTPFPDYESLDSAASLIDKARRGLFARVLDDQVPANATILDCGCGTGQLTNFLALTPDRTVVGADVCGNSLELAQRFKLENGIDNATFVQMNLFRGALAQSSFDLVVANGVLHHTADPRRGFTALTRLARPGGYVLVGLYNTWGRLPTDLRRLVFRLMGNRSERWQGLDPRLRKPELGEARRRSWFNDQYRHPHETKHSIGEVLGWFVEDGVEFVNAIPKATALDRFTADERLFERNPAGSALDHALVQLGMALGSGEEGGLFLVIGRKKDGPE